MIKYRKGNFMFIDGVAKGTNILAIKDYNENS